MPVGGRARALGISQATLSLWLNGYRQPPTGFEAEAAAALDLLEQADRGTGDGAGSEVSRARWTRSLQFTFLETVGPELMIVNPMGMLITYVRGDRALVTR